MKIEAIAFTPGVGAADPLTRHWLRQVTLRLRREIAWLWRERAAQGLVNDTSAAAGAGLPPFIDAAQGALDLARYAQDKQQFFIHDATAAYLSRQLQEPAPQGVDAPRGSFGWVMLELALQPAEAFVLALALLPAVDSAAGAVLAGCLNEPGRSEPTLALAQRLWDEPDALLGCFDPAHRLYSHGLLAPATPGWGVALQMPPLVARELLFPSGAAASTPAASQAPGLSMPPARRRVIPVLGPDAVALAAAAQRAAAHVGLAVMQPGAAPGGEHQAAQLRTQMTLAWLRGAALYLPPQALNLAPAPGHGSSDEAGQAPRALPLPDLPLTLYIGVHERTELRALGDAALAPITVAAASHSQRLAAWRCALPASVPLTLLDELSLRYRCETSVIDRIAAELSLLGRAPSEAELRQATRADLDLGALAQAVPPRFGLAELMLPPAQSRQLAELVTAMRNLARAHHDWGTAKAWSEGGLAALFAGPPGTGKTMAAEALAHELDLPLYRIDLSQVVNKYIGETEKNLKRLFDAADAAEVILFFDEADALFGKRTEVKDAHDRYANLEISYLLERMERFKGLAILATNRRKDLDEAFMRRLRFVIEFPLPGVAERERIWRSVIPEHADASELDFEFLAQRFALAGGHIRAIVFQACLQSAHPDAPRVLTMQAVIRAVQREYDKLERANSLEQFGRYAPLVAAERGAR